MAAHHRLSPSALSALLLCSGQVLMREQRVDTGRAEAAAGETCHQAGHFCLVTGEASSHALKGRKGCVFTVTDNNGVSKELKYDFSQFDEELADLTDEYIEYVRGIPGVGAYEARLDLSRFIPGCWGTSDVIKVDFSHRADKGRTWRVLHVIDAKFGRVRVSAKRNAQLGGYALGKLAQAGLLFEAYDEIVFHIVQPKIRNFSTWTVDIDWLRDLARRMTALYWETELGATQFVPGEEQCVYCPAAGDCRARVDHIMSLIKRDGVLLDVSKLSFQELEQLYVQLDEIEDFIKAVRSTVEARARAGEQLSLTKFVETTGRRRWENDTSAADKLLDLGLSESEVFKKTVVSIGAAEAALGIKGKKLTPQQQAAKDMLSEVIRRPEKKLTLVTLDDDRPAVSPFDDMAAQFEKFENAIT